MWILEARKWGGSVTGPAGWQGGRDDDKHREGRKTGKEEGRGGERRRKGRESATAAALSSI